MPPDPPTSVVGLHSWTTSESVISDALVTAEIRKQPLFAAVAAFEITTHEPTSLASKPDTPVRCPVFDRAAPVPLCVSLKSTKIHVSSLPPAKLVFSPSITIENWLFVAVVKQRHVTVLSTTFVSMTEIGRAH